MELTSAKIREELESGDFHAYRVIVEALSTDYDVIDVAAAAIKLASAADDAAAETAASDVDLNVRLPDEPSAKGKRKGEWSSEGKRPGKREREGKGGDKSRPSRGRGRAGDVVRLFMPVGRTSGVRPADLVGAIANESKINAKLIGTIEISDNFSLVEVPDEYADKIIDALRGTKIRGVSVKVRREKF
jgi:ATP-dependent RNA helicase DeaD